MTVYNLVSIVSGDAIVSPETGMAHEFNSAAIAMDMAKVWGLAGVKPKPVDDGGAWRMREQSRFDSGDYVAPVWAGTLAAIPDHFAHVSTDKPEMLAFTESPEKGMADRQTRIKPGAYLARFYPHLSSDEIERLATAHREQFAPVESPLKWARTPDEIEAVYSLSANFSSCMQHPAHHFDSPIHPCRIYGAGDLALAYILDDDGDLRARALVWPERDLVGRVYGDGAALRAALRDYGIETYSSDSDYNRLDGARMLAVQQDGYYVAPYIDGSGGFCVRHDGEEYLTIESCWDHEASTPDCNQSGFESAYSESGCTCERCGDREPEDEMRTVYRRNGRGMNYEESWCEHCRDYYAFYCSNTYEYYADADFTSIEVHYSRNNWETWCAEVSEDDYYTCDKSDIYVHCNNVTTMADGEVWADWEFEKHGQRCTISDENYPESDCVICDGEWVANDHLPADAIELPNGDYTTEPQEDDDATPRCDETPDMFDIAA